MRGTTKSLAKRAPAVPARRSNAAPVPVKKRPQEPGVGATEETIRLRAYERWEAAGRPGGDGIQFWLAAENELLAAK